MRDKKNKSNKLILYPLLKDKREPMAKRKWRDRRKYVKN